MKTALICGISGQDGSYLAKLLLENNYKVIGTSRDAQVSTFSNLKRLGIFEKIEYISMSLTDFRSVLQAIKTAAPDEIYNLAGQTSVGLSFNQPVETLESITTGTLNILEAIRFLQKDIKFYNACSSECFGNTFMPAVETDAFNPRSPYAVAKSAAFWITSNYREAYNIFACSGILFNHDSPLRPERFVTKKIITTANRIAKGSKEKLKLGNIEVVRDWGWAQDYVEAINLMVNYKTPEDFIIATGESHSLKQFIEKTFELLNLNWQEHCELDDTLMRPTDLAISSGNPQKAKNLLNWEAKHKMADVIKNIMSTL